MKTIFEAIYNKISDSSLDTYVNSRYYPIEAPEGTILPYCVGSIISENYWNELSYKFGSILLEISVCAEDIATMEAAAELVFSLFDNSQLSLSGWYQLGTLERENEHPDIDDGIYRYIIEYRLEVQKI